MTLSIRTRLAALLATAGAASGLAFAAAPAQALTLYVPTGNECTLSIATILGLDTGAALTDPLGYRFDTTSNLNLTIGQPSQYATLREGSNVTLIPGTTITDAYDDWGDLFVGSTESRATQYVDRDPLGCSRENSGNQVAFKATTIGGLTVQRKLAVAPSGAPGARLVESVTNPTKSAVTTSVFVGDLTSNLQDGTLGSDAATKVGETSSGDKAIDAFDRWAVTSDGGLGGDPAIAHVWDGPGGATSATVALSGTPGSESLDTGTQLSPDQFGYGWQNVTIPAGGTASFLSWEILAATSGTWAERDTAQTSAAATAAKTLSAAPSSTIYQGMTSAEIAAVRNWAKPPTSATITPVVNATPSNPTTLSATDIDYGSTTLSQCSGGTLAWDFGDGATATGATVSHTFAAGDADVSLTVTGDCGGVTTKHLSFAVATPTISVGGGVNDDPAPVVAAPPATPAAPSRDIATNQATAPATPLAPADTASQLVVTTVPKMSASQAAHKGISVTAQSSIGGAVRFVVTGPGIKLSKNVTLAPGGPATSTLKFGPGIIAKLKKIKSLGVRAKLTLAGGAEVIQTTTISLHK